MFKTKRQIFFKIREKRAGGGDRSVSSGESKGIERGDPEMRKKRFQSTFRIKTPIIEFIDEERKSIGEVLEKGRPCSLKFARCNEFSGAQAIKRIDQILLLFQLESAELPRG